MGVNLANMDNTVIVVLQLITYRRKGEINMPQGATETSTLKVGDQAPDFTMKAHGDRMITLSEFRGSKNVFLCFYPLDWTPV
ncbi:MAG: redoxin domain-containing protein [Bacillus sp. (in: Bacteria)]|nr:redoxin domain-containing protein [Bacillus sp. (in: firmicutes)]